MSNKIYVYVLDPSSADIDRLLARSQTPLMNSMEGMANDYSIIITSGAGIPDDGYRTPAHGIEAG